MNYEVRDVNYYVKELTIIILPTPDEYILLFRAVTENKKIILKFTYLLKIF